ncbi:solute carrier family 25 member 33-like [Heterodontus francisci]|uniref:solute carrier family 25 member 33-like n=1 Tax=Heterodontus francisci TaxID=7792 RepID=UPI00355AD532
MTQSDPILHLLAGGCGGTVGAILTCPLEVVKTRLQSSGFSLRSLYLPPGVQLSVPGGEVLRPAGVSPRLLEVLRTMLLKEGVRSLFRGLGPNLVGVAPSRAIYFAAYSKAKDECSTVLRPDSTQLHICAATVAGKCLCQLFNCGRKR